MMSAEEKRTNRLNNGEFYNYIPLLELEEMLMIQIKRNGVWCHLFNATYKGQKQFNTLKCIACQEYIQFDMFSKHVKKNSHLQSLKNVDQFYHPIYTYAKSCEKVAKGENISKEEIASAIAQSIEAQGTHDDITFSVSKSIAKYIREQERDFDKNHFEKVLSNLVLSTEVKNPDEFVAEVQLPMEDLLNVEFSKEKGKWARMLTVNRNASSKFYCALCSKYFFGILTIDGHFKGTPHKVEQIACLAVRSPGYPHLTKNCLYACGKKYSLLINKKARETFEEKAYENILSNENEEDANEGVKSEVKEEICSAAGFNVETSGKSADECNKKGGVTNIVTGKGGSTSRDTLSSSIVNKAKALKSSLTSRLEALIGVEYVVKISKSADDIDSMYECCLCEIMLTEKRMQSHLIGYNHRQKYCELHYPDTIKKYNNVIGHTKYSNYFNVMGHILAKVASGIENYHGRSMPYVVSAPEFAVKRAEIIEKVYSFRNACQQQGPSFTDAISPEEIKRIIKENRMYVAAIEPHTKVARFAMVPEGKIYLNQRCHDPNKRNSEVPETRKRARSKISEDKEYQPKSQSSEFGAPKKIKQNDVINQNMSDNGMYRDIFSLASNEVNKKYGEYRKNPEIHPLYDNEWNIFWRRRKEQLIEQGIDHRTYNYQPEWVQFFNQRLEELYQEELRNLNKSIRNRFNPSLAGEGGGMMPGPSRLNDAANIHVDNMKGRDKVSVAINNASISKQNQGDLYTKQFKAWEGFPKANISGNTDSSLEMQMTDDKPTVIHVLRLLTALEDQLGCLGVKIMDLLSKALMLEKTFVNNPVKLEESILTFDNCALLETAVEKLKGILFAGLLDDMKVQGFKRVIRFTTDLLKHAEKMGWRHVVPESSEFSGKPNDNIDLQKLLEIMQTAKRDGGSHLGQKSLSETLRDLIQRKTNSNCSETANQNYLNFSNTSSRSQVLDPQQVGNTSRFSNIRDTSQRETFGMNSQQFHQGKQMQSLTSVPLSNYDSNSSFGSKLNYTNNIEGERLRTSLNNRNSNMNNMNTYNRDNMLSGFLPPTGSQQFGNMNKTTRSHVYSGANGKSDSTSNWNKSSFNNMQW